MKITDIEMIPIAMSLAKRYDTPDGRARMYDIDQHLVVKVSTDNGLTGYGDWEDKPDPVPDSEIEPLIGRNPFDFIHNNFHLAVGMALYDVMGKYLEVPAYKLMGQKVRDAVPVAAWTRPCPPEIFGEEIERAVAQGYTIFKMHSSPFYDVIEQTRAAEEVAPPGLRIHWDFNRNRTLGAVLPLVKEIEENHPIVGFIEDPLLETDIDGWRRLREKTRIPLIFHNPQMGGVQEVIQGMADIYMVGGVGIGDTLVSGFGLGRANIQTIIQQSGNTLMRAFTLHQAAVLPTATAHIVTSTDQYDEDITVEKIPVVEGFSRVPEGPGLGVDVDEDALAKAAGRKHVEMPRFIGVLRLPGGHRFYTIGDPNPRSISAENPGVSRLIGYEEGTVPGISFERWHEDRSAEFEQVYKRVKKEGAYMAGARPESGL